MNFASAIFWQNLGICTGISFVLLFFLAKFRPNHVISAGKLFLGITGIVLLVSESLVTLLSFIWVVSFGWIAVLMLGRESRRFVIIPLLLQLAPLVYFKYWHFFLSGVLDIEGTSPSLLIPMGLSFYTFQTIAFCVDSRAEGFSRPSFLDYWNFSSFFPQIVAGPIERRSALLPQIENFRFNISRSDIEPALRWIVLGLFFKMALADNLGLIFEGLKIDLNNAYHIWFEAFVFSFRIYFDFAGYSMVALGLGRLFGVKLTLNFLSPYFSRNIKEFWRRWHVSLSSWLRDYVYFPIGGNRRGYWFVNVLIVFIVSGIWHGAGWGFIIWGFLHGIGVVFVSQNRGVCLPKALGTIVTFIFVTFTWIFFYERDSSLIQGKVLAVCDLRHYGREAILALPKIFGSGSDLVLALLILGISSVVLAAEGWSARRTELESYDFLKKTSVQVLQIFSIVLLAPMTQSGFIYFNF